MAKIEKWVQYAAQIQPKIAELFSEESDWKIDLQELEDEENLKAFFHALATVVPCDFFNKIVGDDKNHVAFNHTANLLCFQFVKVGGKD